MGRRKKSSPKPYKQDVRRKFKAHQKTPVELSKYYLQKAITKVNNVERKKKKKHPLIENHREGGRLSLNECLSPSVNSVFRNFSASAVYSPSCTYLLAILRKSVMEHNWTFSLQLYQALLEYGALNKRYLIYLLRMILIFLLNSRITVENFDKFMSVTLGIRDEKLKNLFVQSIYKLRKLKFSTTTQVKMKNVVSNSECSDVDDPDEIGTPKTRDPLEKC